MFKIFLFMFLTSAIFAQESGLKPHNIYVAYAIAQTSVESDKIFESEPMKNILGGNSIRQELEIGWNFQDNGYRYQPFLYGWFNDKNKYNEKGAGVGLNFHTKEMQSIPIRILFTVAAGIGFQSNNGARVTTSTNVTNISYVTGGSIQTGTFEGTFQKDTEVIEINLGVGFVYDITQSIYFTTEYKYIQKYYNFHYVLDGATTGMALSGIEQSNHNFQIGLTYVF